MWPFNKWLNLSLSLVLCYLVVLSSSQNPVERFEYKYSFKPPYLAQKDGSVPFWEYGGNCIASLENVRVAPSLRSQKGKSETSKE
ncbi:protein ERGIC-53-like [Diaphorina citri]|uniref:Protein ERGIC-53-like n=1 Tax=Diaphorina citri TaxID=121845 RepID=A0A1S4ET16_DIACI|nr:protein ERGIC-53-like [Diaphorina citri]